MVVHCFQGVTCIKLCSNGDVYVTIVYLADISQIFMYSMNLLV